MCQDWEVKEIEMVKLTEESPKEFLARLRKKAKDHKAELSFTEEIFLEVMDKSEGEAVLGGGSGSKL